MKALIFTALFLLNLNANAGSAGGPYVVWVNLSNNSRIEKIINDRIESHSDCNRGGLIVVQAPEWISKSLVKSAIFDKNKKSLSELKKLLKRPYSSMISDGFDGIIAYDEKSAPRFSGIALKWSKVISENISKDSNDNDQWEFFCTFVPPIGRSAL